MAVDHPVGTVDQSYGFSVTGSHKRPLGGVLSASVGLLLPSGSVPYQIAAGTRCFPAGPDEFDVQKDDDAIANNTRAVKSFFYGRRLPFDTLLNPNNYRSKNAFSRLSY